MVHVAKINLSQDMPRLGPRITSQHVVVDGIAVNHAASQAWQDMNDFRFIQRKKCFHQRAPLRSADILDIVLDPTGARRIPFQFAMRSGVRKRLQRRVHLAKKPAEIAKKLRRMRPNFGENRSTYKRKKPDEARRAVSCRTPSK